MSFIHLYKLLLQMQEQRQNKIYYKGNPITNQNFVPISALKNRTRPSYLVQFPQGQQYFNGSRKKQYASLHHQSEIQKMGLFDADESTYNHGTYEVSDIQGAMPNTLLSQAVKNRAKGHSRQYGRNFRSPKSPYDNSSMNSGKLATQQVSQYQLQRKLLENRTQFKNYHLVHNHRVQTQPTNLDSPENKQINHEVSFRYRPEPVYIPQGTQTEHAKIKDLEQLLFNKQEDRLKRTIQDSPQYAKKQNNRLSEEKYDSQKIRKSQKQIAQMWHGDHHKIQLYPRNQIRRLNPTYLSSQNFLDTQQKYKNFLPQIK